MLSHSFATRGVTYVLARYINSTRFYPTQIFRNLSVMQCTCCCENDCFFSCAVLLVLLKKLMPLENPLVRITFSQFFFRAFLMERHNYECKCKNDCMNLIFHLKINLSPLFHVHQFQHLNRYGITTHKLIPICIRSQGFSLYISV